MNKNLNRFFVILVCISLLIGVIVFPASAASFENAYDGNLINYFDYYNGDLNFKLTQSNNSITFDLPTASDLRYVDFTFFCWAGYGLSDVIIELGGYSQSLNLVNLSTGIIRAYGLPNGTKSLQDHFTLTFVFSYSTCEVSFFSFKYSSTTFDSFPEVGGIYAQPSSLSSFVYMSNADTPVTVNFNTEPGTISNYYGWVSLSNWRKYDSMDVLLKVDSGGLSSLSVSIDDMFLPFSVTGYDSSNGSINYVEWDYDSVMQESLYYFNYEYTYQWVLIHIDLSNVSRTITDQVNINFTGNITANKSTQGIVLSSVNGYFEIDTISPLGYFFKDLKTFLQDLFTPDDDVKEEINTGISNNESTEQDIMTGIDDIGSDPADIDIDVIIEQSGADTNLIAAFFSVFFNNVIILRTFWLAALFIVIGYIFHGQR